MMSVTMAAQAAASSLSKNPDVIRVLGWSRVSDVTRASAVVTGDDEMEDSTSRFE